MKNRPVYKKKTSAARAAELVRATQDEKFVAACTLAGIPPSARQHRKFLRGAGAASGMSLWWHDQL
jgi:hypothetical protein